MPTNSEDAGMIDPTDDLTRRIADCLEQHLPTFGFEPFRYPSGENKSIHLLRPGVLVVEDEAGRAWTVTVAPVTRP